MTPSTSDLVLDLEHGLGATTAQRGSSPTQATTRRANTSIAIVGAGGHGRELADIVRAVHHEDERTSLLGIVDDGDPDLAPLARAGIRFLGRRAALIGRELDVFLGIGDPSVRAVVAREVPDPTSFLAHPTAQVGSGALIGAGSVLAQGVIVTTNVQIGRHSHVNVAATISHDCRLGDFVTVAPHATLTGDVHVGDGAYVGAGATVLPGIRIGRGALVGAGAVVTDDVASGTTVVGVPARRVDNP